MPLVVVQAFRPYDKGVTISDAGEIAAVLAGPNRVFVVPVTDLGGGTASPGSSSQAAPASGSASGLPSLVVAADIKAGMPVTFSRAAQRLVAAQAGVKALSFVMGVLAADAKAGFAAAPSQGVVTLNDWTASTGASALAAGQPYFLDASGGLTTAPDRTAVACIAAVGVALSPTTMMVAPTTPIEL